jgi:hypothetical protein
MVILLWSCNGFAVHSDARGANRSRTDERIENRRSPRNELRAARIGYHITNSSCGQLTLYYVITNPSCGQLGLHYHVTDPVLRAAQNGYRITIPCCGQLKEVTS